MAGFPTATGHTNWSGTQIATIWASVLLTFFYQTTCLAQITTTEFESQIEKFGDTLRIRTLPTPVIHDYVKGMELEVDELEPGYVDLVIDKGLYHNYILDSVDIKQMDYDAMSKWAAHISQFFKIEMDRRVLQDIYADADAHNKGATAGLESGDINLGVSGTPLALTKTNIIDKITECGVVLDEQNIPNEGRFIVLPARTCGLIKQSDLKDASLTGDGQSILRNGRIGMIDRFEIYMSNAIASVTDTHKCFNALFGHKKATAWATQLVENKQYEPEKRFGKGNKQMAAYGYEVVHSDALGHLYYYHA